MSTVAVSRSAKRYLANRGTRTLYHAETVKPRYQMQNTMSHRRNNQDVQRWAKRLS